MPVSKQELLYLLKADGTDLAKALKKGEKDFKSFAAKARSTLNDAGTALAGGGLGFAALVQNEINQIDQLQKLGQIAGLAAEDMGTLQLAAELGRVEVKDLTENIGTLIEEIDDGGKKLKRFGIDFKDSVGNTLPTLDVVGNIADRIQELGPSAESTSIALSLFGDEGARMLPILLQGSEGLAKMREEADKLGITFDEKTGRAAAKFNDDTRRMKLALQGTFRTIVADGLPVMTRYANHLLTSSTESERLGKTSVSLGGALKGLFSIVEGVRASFAIAGRTIGFLPAVFSIAIETILEKLSVYGATLDKIAKRTQSGDWDLGKVVDDVNEALDKRAALNPLKKYEAAWKRLVSEVEGSAVDLNSALNVIWNDVELDPLPEIPEDPWRPPTESASDFADILKIVEQAQQDALADLKKLDEEGARIFDATRTPLEKFNLEVERLDFLLDNGFVSLDTYARALDQAKESFLEATKPVDEFGTEAQRVFEQTRTPVERFNIEVERLGQLLAAGAIDGDTFNRRIDQLKTELDEATKAAGDATSEMRELGREAAEELFGTFEDALFDPFEKSTKEMVADFAEALGRMALRAASTKILNSLFAASTPATPGIAGPFGFASGGPVRGPGTSTSDSIPARLSDGEFVMRARAHAYYGTDFMRKLNALQLPRRGYAEGGAVSAPNVEVPLNVAVMRSEEELARFMRSRSGQKLIVDAMRQNPDVFK